MSPDHRVSITYCARCGWLLRASWMAQELLTTFAADLAEVALRPGPSGAFRIDVDASTVWDRTINGGFPDIADLKRRVRDVIAPGRTLGHIEGATQ